MPKLLEPRIPYTVYYMEGCPYSEGAVELLMSNGINYSKIIRAKAQLKSQFGEKATFPRIFDDHGKLVGGYDDLSKMLNKRSSK